MSLEQLPQAIVSQVASFLAPVDLPNLELCSRNFKALITDDVWRASVTSELGLRVVPELDLTCRELPKQLRNTLARALIRGEDDEGALSRRLREGPLLRHPGESGAEASAALPVTPAGESNAQMMLAGIEEVDRLIQETFRPSGAAAEASGPDSGSLRARARAIPDLGAEPEKAVVFRSTMTRPKAPEVVSAKARLRARQWFGAAMFAGQLPSAGSQEAREDLKEGLKVDPEDWAPLLGWKDIASCLHLQHLLHRPSLQPLPEFFEPSFYSVDQNGDDPRAGDAAEDPAPVLPRQRSLFGGDSEVVQQAVSRKALRAAASRGLLRQRELDVSPADALLTSERGVAGGEGKPDHGDEPVRFSMCADGCPHSLRRELTSMPPDGRDACIRLLGDAAFPALVRARYIRPRVRVQALEYSFTDEHGRVSKRLRHEVGLSFMDYFEVSVAKECSSRCPHLQPGARAPKRRRAKRVASPQEECRMRGEHFWSIGLASRQFNLQGVQPGWTRKSYALHADDGSFFHADPEESVPFTSPVLPGSTLGFGRCNLSGTIFFTRDGALIGSPAAFTTGGASFPTIGVCTSHKLTIRDGHSAPFVFDIAAFEAQEFDGRELPRPAQMIPRTAPSFVKMNETRFHWGRSLEEISGEALTELTSKEAMFWEASTNLRELLTLADPEEEEAKAEPEPEAEGEKKRKEKKTPRYGALDAATSEKLLRVGGEPLTVAWDPYSAAEGNYRPFGEDKGFTPVMMADLITTDDQLAVFARKLILGMNYGPLDAFYDDSDLEPGLFQDNEEDAGMPGYNFGVLNHNNDDEDSEDEGDEGDSDEEGDDEENEGLRNNEDLRNFYEVFGQQNRPGNPEHDGVEEAEEDEGDEEDEDDEGDEGEGGFLTYDEPEDEIRVPGYPDLRAKDVQRIYMEGGEALYDFKVKTLGDPWLRRFYQELKPKFLVWPEFKSCFPTSLGNRGHSSDHED